MSDVTQDDDWASVDLSATGNEEQEQIEIEIEGQEQEEPAQAVEVAAQEIEIEDSAEPEVVQQVHEEEEEEQPKELEGIKTKGAEKRIKQLIRQRKEKEEEVQKLRGELDALKNSSVQKDLQLSSSLKHNINSQESQLEATIETARQLYKQAADSGDTDGMLQAQENLSKTYAEMSQVEQRKQAWEEYNRSVEQSQEQQQQVQQEGAGTPEYDPKAIEWAGRNGWFGEDQILTAAALTIDQELKNEGYDPSDEDFYEAIDSRLQQKYPTRFQVEQEEDTPRLQDTTTNSAQVVAGASRTPKTSSNGRNKIKLTQEDVRLANKWGIPLERYAAEKLKVEQADGEYTSV
jgi:hypothetical protein